MTVVNPKSISGINSITMASGSDDLLTIHSNNTTERVRVNNSGDVIVGSGITLSPDGDIFATGITTVSGNVKVGTGITLSPDGDVFATGVCTATSFSGDGSNLTGIDADKISEGNTEAEVVDTGSDGHFKVTTEGTERIRVGPSGQIGIAGANYGESGQVLQSQGSGSVVQWATPASGWVHAAEVTLPTNASTYTFTGIPDGASHIRYLIRYMSFAGTAQAKVQLQKSTTGGSTSIISSNYISFSSYFYAGGANGGANSDSVDLFDAYSNPANSFFGIFEIFRIGTNGSDGTNYYMQHFGVNHGGSNPESTFQSGSYIELGTGSTDFISGAKFYANTGENFDNGYINQSYLLS